MASTQPLLYDDDPYSYSSGGATAAAAGYVYAKPINSVPSPSASSSRDNIVNSKSSDNRRSSFSLAPPSPDDSLRLKSLVTRWPSQHCCGPCRYTANDPRLGYAARIWTVIARQPQPNPKTERYLLWAYSAFSCFVFFLMFYFNYFAANTTFGQPELFTCSTTMWPDGIVCGVEGSDCRPFYSREWRPFRCMDRCAWKDNTTGLDVWGNGIYRANSHACRAAIHSGVIPSTGGCALLRLSGSQQNFSGGTVNGIISNAFDSWFPRSFEFRALGAHEAHHCGDFAWGILTVFIVLGAIACYLRPPKNYLFGYFYFFGYWYTAFTVFIRFAPHNVLVVGSDRMFILASMGYFLYRWGGQYALFLTRPAKRFIGSSSDYDLDRSIAPDEEGPLASVIAPEQPSASSVPTAYNVNRDRGVSSAVHTPLLQPMVVPSPRNSSRSRNNNGSTTTPTFGAANVASGTIPPPIDVGVNASSSSGPNAPHSPSSTLHYGRSPRFSDNSATISSGIIGSVGSNDVAMENKVADGKNDEPDPHLFLASRQWPWWYNIVFYFLSFVLSLHLNLATYILPNISLNSQMFSFGAKGLITVSVGIVLVIGLMVYHCRLVYQARLCRRYGVFYLLTAVILVFLTLSLASDFSVHIHHSFHPLLLWPLTRFPNRPVVSFSQGLLGGIFVNGLAIWGWQAQYDPLIPAASRKRLLPTSPIWLKNQTTYDFAGVEWPEPDFPDSRTRPIAYSLQLNGVEVQHLPIDDPNDHPFDTHDNDDGHDNTLQWWQSLDITTIGRRLSSLSQSSSSTISRTKVKQRRYPNEYYEARVRRLTQRALSSEQNIANRNRNSNNGNGNSNGKDINGHGGGYGTLEYRYDLTDNVTTIVYFRDGLKPNTTYSFTIVYVYEYGDYGKPSTPVQVTTLPLDPIVPSSSTGTDESSSSSSSSSSSGAAPMIVHNEPLGAASSTPSSPIVASPP